MWKEFFYFNRFERRAVLLITTLLVAVILLPYLWPAQEEPLPYNDPARYEAFLAYQQENGNPPKERKKQQERPADKIQAKPFDPNTATESDLLGMGLPQRIVRNTLKYREKGGRFRKPEDFRKIYGMTDELFTTLRPYLAIQDQAEGGLADARPLRPADTLPASRPERIPSRKYTEKYPAGTIVELNLADTAELKKIPGIGSFTARNIVSYRNRLGGFYSPEQLVEINPEYSRFISWFRTDTTRLRKINLNRHDIRRLMQHPYLNFYQARVIDQHRKKRGELRRLIELSLYEEFSEQDLARLRPYVVF